MKKVLIVSSADKRHMSMVQPYIEYLQSKDIDYDIIRTCRYDSNDKLIDGVKEFVWIKKISNSRFSKIIPYLKFRKFVKREIKKNNYSFIIVWNENTAILLNDILTKKYKGKFCVNIRDVYTRKSIYGHIMHRVLKKASFITYPSPDYYDDLDFKSYSNFLILYNRDSELLKICEPKTKFSNGIIKLTYLGFYHSAPDTFKKIAKLFKNDNRFQLFFYGLDFDTIFKKFCEEEKINNVIVGGAFSYEKTGIYLENTDIINSYYNNFASNKSLQFAMGIKESYTPLLNIPSLVDDNTTWGRIGKELGLVFCVDDHNILNLPDNLYNWYCSLNFDEFKNKCCEFNKIIDKSREELFNLCDKYIGGSYEK